MSSRPMLGVVGLGKNKHWPKIGDILNWQGESGKWWSSKFSGYPCFPDTPIFWDMFWGHPFIYYRCLQGTLCLISRTSWWCAPRDPTPSFVQLLDIFWVFVAPILWMVAKILLHLGCSPHRGHPPEAWDATGTGGRGWPSKTRLPTKRPASNDVPWTETCHLWHDLGRCRHTFFSCVS